MIYSLCINIMDFHKQLQRIKVVTGYTQTQLAEMLGVSFPTVNSWLHAKSTPRGPARKKVQDLYFRYTGNTDIQKSALLEQQQQLDVLAQQHPEPFRTIMASRSLYDALLLEMTYHTNSIEGSTLDEPQVRAVLFDDVTIPNKTVREHQEVKNHQGALGFLMRWLRDEGGDLTQALVQKIHSILMNGILHNAGEYRTHKVRIAGSHVATSNPLSIAQHMDDFIPLYNSEPRDIVAHIAQTHAHFEQIHPFSDGNGRVGRLLMLLLGLKYGLAPVLVQKEKKTAYYSYLQEAQLRGNHIPLNSFVYDGLFEGYRLMSDV